MRSSALSRVASAVFPLPLIYDGILFHLPPVWFPAQLSSSLVAFIKMFRGLRASALTLRSVHPRKQAEAIRIGMSAFRMSYDAILGQKLAAFFFFITMELFFLFACSCLSTRCLRFG